MNDLRINDSSGAPLEKTGYLRMVKLGNQVYIGGTTSVQPDGSVYGTTQYEQANYIFEKMPGFLSVQAPIFDVVGILRTRKNWKGKVRDWIEFDHKLS